MGNLEVDSINESNTEARLTLDSKVKNMQQALDASWNSYYSLLHSQAHELELPACLKLLNVADELLNQNNDLANSSEQQRFLIGGINDLNTQKQFNFNIQLLGDMQNFASFKKLLKNNPIDLNKLMKIIPSTGTIDGWHFMQFIDSYQQLFLANGFKQAPLFPATKLLCMKRPDQFVALSDETSEIFYQAFSIKPIKKLQFQRYWDEVITPIQQTEWFKTDQPMDTAQLPFHRVRVALLERFAVSPKLTLANETSVSTLPKEASEEQVEKTILTNDNNIKSDMSTPVTKPESLNTKQPKKLTIAKRKSAKVNQTAATKLMSQYYFANREKFSKVDVKKYREDIIQQLVDGESVEEIFASLLANAG